MQSSSTSWVTTTTVASIILLSILLQFNIFFNQDTSWLMHAGQRLLAGGNYANNFFEVNPPMAIYLYLPAVWLAKLWQNKFYVSSFIYTFIIGSYSLFSCYLLSHKIFTAQQKLIQAVFVISLSFIFFLMPVDQFSEREHLMLLLTLPYLLLVISRCSDKNISILFASIIGLLAGIGFIIKPHFLLAWLLLEIYWACKNRSVSSWMRPEFFAVILVAASYALSIPLFTPDYLTIVAPSAVKYYYVSFAFPLAIVIIQPLVAFLFIVSVFYLALRPFSCNKNLTDVLQIYLIAFLCIHLMQRTLWAYHIFPALAVALLLLIILLISLLQQRKEMATVFWALILLTAIPLGITGKETVTQLWQKQHSIRNQFFNLINSQAKNGTIYFFSDLITATYPTVDYTQTHSPSRYPCLWLIDSLEYLQNNPLNAQQQQQINSDKNKLIANITTDLNSAPPDLIFIQFKSVNWQRLGIQINFFDLLQQDPRLNSLWRNYSYLTKLGGYLVYKKI